MAHFREPTGAVHHHEGRRPGAPAVLIQNHAPVSASTNLGAIGANIRIMPPTARVLGCRVSVDRCYAAGRAGHGRSGGCGPGRQGAAGSGCSERPRHHSSITLSDPGRLKNARSPAQSGGGFGSRTAPSRCYVRLSQALPVVACYLSGPVAGFMHPGCRRGAGLVATGKSGADAGSVFASGGQAAVSAVCVAAQALWVPVPPPTSRSGCTPRRSAGRAPGGWKDSPPAITAAAHPTVPAGPVV